MQGVINRELQGSELEICVSEVQDIATNPPGYYETGKFGVIRYLTEKDIEKELNEMVESGGLQEYIQSRAEMDKEEGN
jgi:hypothetical protein